MRLVNIKCGVGILFQACTILDPILLTYVSHFPEGRWESKKLQEEDEAYGGTTQLEWQEQVACVKCRTAEEIAKNLIEGAQRGNGSDLCGQLNWQPWLTTRNKNRVIAVGHECQVGWFREEKLGTCFYPNRRRWEGGYLKWRFEKREYIFTAAVKLRGERVD